MTALIIFIGVLAAAGVWMDGRRLDWAGRRYGATDWTIAVAVLWVVFLPLYIVRRPRRHR